MPCQHPRDYAAAEPNPEDQQKRQRDTGKGISSNELARRVADGHAKDTQQVEIEFHGPSIDQASTPDSEPKARQPTQKKPPSQGRR